MSKKINIGIGLGAVALIIIGVYVFIQWANSPVSSSVKVSDTPVTVPITPENQTITTPFYSIMIPGEFRTRTTENATDPSMIQLTAFATQGSDIQIGITSALLPAEGINGIADYLYRIKNPTLYVSTEPFGFPLGNPSFEKQGNETELTTFITNGQRYASVVVGGASVDKNEARRVFEVVARNWQWQ